VTYNSGGQESFSVAVADVNQDGKPDLLIANTCGQTCTYEGDGVISVLLGNGDGTFQAPLNYDSGDIGPRSLTAVDLNQDGKIDIVVANSGAIDGSFFTSGSLAVLLGNGDGTFQAAATYAVGPSPWSLAVGDVNHDGKLDALVADSCWCGHDAELAVLLGNGDGTFQSAVTYDSGNQDSFSIAVADINGDGYPDLVAGSLGTNALSVLPGNGDGTFQPALTFNTGSSGIDSIATADLNGDGKADVVSTDGEYVSVLLNDTGSSRAQTSMALTSSLNPSGYGQSVTFTAAVSSGSGTPGGTVVFYNGTTSLGRASLANGSTSLSATALSAGSHPITAAYLGSNRFAPASSPVVSQFIDGTATSATSLRSSLNPSVAGEVVTFTATVTSSSGTPAGTVIFYDGTTAEIGSAALNGGIASLSVPSLSAAAHSVTAAFQGSGDISPSTSRVLIQAVKTAGPFISKTTLTSSASPSFIGQPVTFTATVTSKHSTIPDGELVTFRDGSGVIGTATTASSVAKFTTSTLVARAYAIQADYSGDWNVRPSFGTVRQTVELYPTTTALSSSSNPSTYGDAVTFTATVTSAGPDAPTGAVTFTDGTAGIGTARLNGGVATLTKSKLLVGTHAITARYDGNAESAKSASPVLDQVVQ
jgi:Bacterial Ig-like domain (group 3)/FG-GAP-like repeat/FG-GAP repeat